MNTIREIKKAARKNGKVSEKAIAEIEKEVAHQRCARDMLPRDNVTRKTLAKLLLTNDPED